MVRFHKNTNKRLKELLNKISSNIYLWLIVITGGILRFTVSVTHSYSSDELSTITRLRINNFNDFFEIGVKTGDMHPAGIQVFEKIWSSFFGTSELALRFPFVVAGIVAIVLTYRLGVELLSKQAGLIAALLMSLTFFPILQSELARPYSFGVVFSLLVALYFFKLNNSNNSKSKWLNSVKLGLSFSLAMYTHYFDFMLVALMGISGLFFIKKTVLKQYIFAGALAVILFLPHINITLYHLSVDGGLQWLAPPSKYWLFNFIFYVFNESWWLIASIIIILIITLKSVNQIEIKNKQAIKLFAIWFFGIYIVGFIFSYVSSPILKFPVMYFPLPFLFLLISIPFSKLDKKKFKIIFSVLFLIILLTTIFEKQLYKNKHFGVLKELVEPILKWQKKYGKKNIVTYMNVSNPYYLNYYAHQFEDTIKFNKDRIEYGESQQIYNELLTTTQPYCIVGYSTRETLPQLFETCYFFYPYIVEYHQYFNSNVILLSKIKPLNQVNQTKKVLDEFAPTNSNSKWSFNANKLLNNYYLLDSLNRYGPDFIFKLSDLGFKSVKAFNKKYYLKIEVQANFDIDAQLTATLTAKRNGELIKTLSGENLWFGKNLEPIINHPKNNEKGFFATFIPLELETDDEIMISLWNRNGKPIKIKKITIYLMENIWR